MDSWKFVVIVGLLFLIGAGEYHKQSKAEAARETSKALADMQATEHAKLQEQFAAGVEYGKELAAAELQSKADECNCVDCKCNVPPTPTSSPPASLEPAARRSSAVSSSCASGSCGVAGNGGWRPFARLRGR